MKYATLICVGSIISILHSCAFVKQTKTDNTCYENQFHGIFQRYHQWNDSCQSKEILTINRDGSFSICIKETTNGLDTGYYCSGVYWKPADSTLPCLILQTRNAQTKTAIDRIAYPIDGNTSRINLWNSHDVCICMHGCDTIFETSNDLPYVRVQTFGVLDCP